MKKVSKIDAAYIAGFFDGEGNACAKGSKYCNPRLSISQKRSKVLYHIRYVLGYGRIQKVGPKPIYQLHIEGKERVIEFALLMLPYSRTKRKELEVIIKLANLILGPGERKGANQKAKQKAVSNKNLKTRLKLKDELKRLKKVDSVKCIRLKEES